MRERAAEVGGTLEVATDAHGWLVTARLPLS
jgi:signal transduction histidine kinase